MKTIDTEQVIYSKRLFKFNRRYCFAAFLSFAVILVILILPILPPPVSVFRERQEIVVEKSCGEENINGKNILVAYETKYGSTATVAEKIGDVLCEEGFQVDIHL